MVLAAQVASRVFTFFAFALALVAVASPYWGLLSYTITTNEQVESNVMSRGLYWPWSSSESKRNASGVYYRYETPDFSDCRVRGTADALFPFNYVGPFCNGKGADGALWVTAFFGAMTVVLGVLSLVLDVRRSGSNLHIGSLGALLFSSILTLSVYLASSAFQDAGLRSCANASFIFAGRNRLEWNAVCKDQVMGWGITIATCPWAPASGPTSPCTQTISGTATGASYLCELSAAVMAFLALICAYIARLKLRAEGGGDVQLGVKVDP
jgi:hypothetical protein